ncbi:Synaptosomal-associated protein 47 [Plecturocebus cupreus]
MSWCAGEIKDLTAQTYPHGHGGDGHESGAQGPGSKPALLLWLLLLHQLRGHMGFILQPQRQKRPGPRCRQTQEQMSRDVCIHTWPCTYYLEPERRWVTGQLSLTSLSLRFVTDSTGETLVSFPLSSIAEIKKEASHFIFSSITVLEKGHAKHWFSSLRPSRNVVFSVIEHFWRELLLSQPAADASAPRTPGKELTALMAGSQKRLEDTARVLHHQGQQLDGVMKGLDKMESDLEVADRWACCAHFAGHAQSKAHLCGGSPHQAPPGHGTVSAHTQHSESMALHYCTRSVGTHSEIQHSESEAVKLCVSQSTVYSAGNTQ